MTPPAAPSSCPRCGASVWWARTYAPELIPFDAEPNVERAAWALTWRATAGELQAERLGLAAGTAGRRLYRAHYLTCQAAGAEVLPLEPKEAPE